MPGARFKFKPESADEFPACIEESQLELHLQRQLEEDVARIFDESIYSDLEVVCGKLKVLTHSCILKARTHNFYHKLQTILHVNIGRSTFDEIYSFISDAYTECNIQHQEKEIITYLDNNLSIVESESPTTKIKEDTVEPEVFLTPKCISPYVEKGVEKVINSSPSTELTKEYYALVPIDGTLLDKELIEQDALSNAFQSIIKSQTEDTNQSKVTQRNKPTSLSLNSSHTSKTVKHSNSCDILSKKGLEDNTTPKFKGIIVKDIKTSQDSFTNQVDKSESSTDEINIKNINACGTCTDKPVDPAYSPDSLITDEPSSSSDYLSAAYTCSPGASSSGHIPQLNVGISTTKMENIFTLSDSGLENTAMLGSTNSHKDVTLTDVSLSESTLHDFATDDASNSAVSISSSVAEKNIHDRSKHTGAPAERDHNGQTSNTNIFKEFSRKSSKEEKQRQNEEIVILESSSLSSETGSWESVYPPKFAEKDICEKFLNTERQNCLDEIITVIAPENQACPNSDMKPSLKTTSCFIDASSLVDEEDQSMQILTTNMLGNEKLDLPAPSQPVPCSTSKLDISPSDWSEGNENEDSLEQADKKDPDSIQKDLSPTIFEMTPITEDSLCANTFENTNKAEIEEISKVNQIDEETNHKSDREKSLQSSTIFMSSTPNNSIMSLKTYKHYDSDDNKSIEGSEQGFHNKSKKDGHSPPILSGGVSVEDHLPLLGSSRENSPLPKWKLENVPIVSGAYVSQPTEQVNQVKPRERASSASAWVVDMSIETIPDESLNESCNKSEESVTEKKNIFSMYIDLGDKSTLKEMPSRLSSSLSAKKNASTTESKPAPKCLKSSNVFKDTSFPKDPEISNQSVSIFEKYESLCNDPNISISEIIGIPEKHSTITEMSEDSEIEGGGNKNNRTQLISDKITPRKPEVIKEEPTFDDYPSCDLFVKLSDLDKPIQKSDATLVDEPKEIDVRMTRSIPDNNWNEQPAMSTNSRSIEVISSFHSENALSLNRLFPHLKNEFSRSMPGSLSSRTRSPLRLGTSSTLGDPEEQVSDVSEVSSMQSSICRSGFGNSTTDSQTSSLIENCTSRLGQDLLRMFLEEIAPDVIVEVSGKRFKAHKCILSSRCQYFAGILSGGWVESLGNVIVLPPFSYNVAYFALCHIYSGLATIPDSVSIVELATIADMLGLEGLKEAIMFTLKAKYCHHFHKPCAVCIVGVLECFPLSSVYGLDDLYHKCLKWITKHFSKVWPTKAFATLPTDLLDKCYQHHIVNLSVESLVDTVYGCGVTASSLQSSRWAESVARMCRRLINAAAHFAAPRLVAVLRGLAPLAADAPPPATQALDDCVAAAIDWAPPDEACRAYHFLSTLVRDMRAPHYAKPDLIGGDTKTPAPNNLLYTHASSWRLQCEGALVRATPRVVSTQAFRDLPSDLRKRLRELGCIMYGAAAIPLAPSASQDRKSRSAYHSKSNKFPSSSTTRSVDIAHVRASFVPYSAKPVMPVGSVDKLKSNNDLRDLRKSSNSVPPQVRTTKAQEERAKFNKYKNNTSQERLNGKAVRTPSFDNTKSRYLNSKMCKDNKLPVVRRLIEKGDTSSESSRNSSPIMLRNLKSSSLKPRQAETKPHAMSQDSLATSSRPRTAEPSTDSLSESQNSNKYATYTKTKHPVKGSVESVKSTKCHNSIHNSKPSINNNTKIKTKIPVYLNQPVKSKTVENKTTKEPQKKVQAGKSSGPPNNKSVERKLPGSLMNATKSSSAKMVPRVSKESHSNKSTSKSHKVVHVSRHQGDTHPAREIPIMERSGTFLKDEPTFGDKTTNIDIDQ